MKITKQQLQNIIKEEVTKTLREDANDDTFEMLDALTAAMGHQRVLEELVQAMERSNAHDLLVYIARMNGVDDDRFQGDKMKITKDQLRKIIKEEISDRDKDTMNDVIAELKKAVQAHKSQHERLQAILDRLVDSEGE